MKVTIDPRNFLYAFIGISLALVLIAYYVYLRPIKTIHYRGRPFVFREDVKDAKDVEVHPNETVIHDLFWDPEITDVIIYFKPLEGTNDGHGYYATESFELTYKLSLLYSLENLYRDFNATTINSYDDIPFSPTTLSIALVHPDLTEKTSVEADGNKLFIHGDDQRNFDLATMRAILIAMGEFSQG